VALMLIVGQRVVPWILHFVAQTRSRELFRLSVLAIALGVAYGATHFFGVSFALGAFFAGMVMSSSTLSQQAMRETLPLRDAFAVLFFVSVGMLFNPGIIIDAPLTLLGTVLIILFVKSARAWPDDRRQPCPDRRVLLHSDHDGRNAGHRTARGAGSCCSGRDDLDPGEPASVPPSRPARAAEG
jgi:CPA2 family monovalent cation:H+ antiporter-2